MSNLGIRDISIIGQNDERICVHGENRGQQGVYLSEGGVSHLYDSPEKQTWKQGARQQRAKQKNRKSLARDMDLQFTVRETPGRTAEQNESQLVQAVGFELDRWDDAAKLAKVALSTDVSGTRYLEVVQYEDPDLDPKTDPIRQQLLKPVLKIRAGDPDWYEIDADSPYGHQFTQCTFTSDGWGEIEVANPTNRVMAIKWVCTVGTWLLPDPSWRGAPNHRRPGGPDAARMLPCPTITAVDGGLVVDRDPDELMARTPNNTNLLARFGAKFLQYDIPPYTQKQMLPVYVEDVPTNGAAVHLVQPRRWSRPWGLEKAL